MLKIGDFSKLSRVSIRMLRHYDEIGLLRPVRTDPASGYRWYGEEQLSAAGKIVALREMGFGLSAIGEILRGGDGETLERLLRLKELELADQVEELERRRLLLGTALERLRKENNMNYDVVLKTLPERYAACVRMVLPSYAQEGELWHVMVEETAGLKLQFAEPCYSSVVYYDKEFKETGVDAEAQMTVKGSYPDTQHVKFRTLPPVTFAACTFKGPYEQIGAVNEAVAAWVRDNGYEFDGPMFNIYHVSPAQTQDPEQFVTEVCYPVKKR